VAGFVALVRNWRLPEEKVEEPIESLELATITQRIGAN
jgi:hypothetical protein